MEQVTRRWVWGRLGSAVLGALIMLAFWVGSGGNWVVAGPIPPPTGYPKLSLSIKSVTPTLTSVGESVLTYTIEIRNTGGYTAENVRLTDIVPTGTVYRGDVWSSAAPTPTVVSGVISWTGRVGFDAVVWVRFSVSTTAALSGVVRNTAMISQAALSQTVWVTAESRLADGPVFSLTKAAAPDRPGANQPLYYTLTLVNLGQPAVDLPITVSDAVPSNTVLRDIGMGGATDSLSRMVTWTRRITLATGASMPLTFSVRIGDVPSGTVVTNALYQVAAPPAPLVTGTPHTVTVIDPILVVAKTVFPDPVGSNREATYTISVFNRGSVATGLVITDQLPGWTDYRRGGVLNGNVVSWTLPLLEPDARAQLTYTVYISDVFEVAAVNDRYGACCDQGVCAVGQPLTNVIHGPVFDVSVVLDPIAKKPGGGGGPVTPTLVVRNLGPGNALSATALLQFERISVSANDLYAIPAVGSSPPFPSGASCGDRCITFVWVGDLALGDVVTFTTTVPQSTIGGEEGVEYKARIIITDSLYQTATLPFSETAVGRVTHLANLIPVKEAPAIAGRGELLTYTLRVWNSALATDSPPLPVLTDTIPSSMTLVAISDGGVSRTVSGTTIVSWTLPALGTGDSLSRWFTVRVGNDLVSGTALINKDYRVSWYEDGETGVYSNTGEPVTTTVHEVGLVDSYKVVTPAIVMPGERNVLTYILHISNTSGVSLSGVTVTDQLPWQVSTYQRDAVASAGQLVSDIVSLGWTGAVSPYAEQLITLTVKVDPWYKGPVTNTMVISHPLLLAPVTRTATAYVTDQPVLQISKAAYPDPAVRNDPLEYRLRVVNLGQRATDLVVTDVVPLYSAYIPGSATGNGQILSNTLSWNLPELGPGAEQELAFRVSISGGLELVNAQYGVRSAEGITATGIPLHTKVTGGGGIYLPIVMRNGR